MRAAKQDKTILTFAVSLLFYAFSSAVLVTAVAFVEGRFVEVDAVHMTKELLVLPRGHQHTLSQLDYFCSTVSATSKPGMWTVNKGLE